ncbi:hypothetical protein KRP22_012192 [Phytophthora ramorum]|nr:hypothetical protein KRP22_14896 [Phytophthora ramorum]
MAPSAPRSQTNTDGLTTSTASPSWLSPGLSAVCTQWVPWNACRNARCCQRSKFLASMAFKSDSKRQNSLSTYKSRSSFGPDGKMPSRRNRRTWRNNRQSRSTRKQPLSAAVSGDSS